MVEPVKRRAYDASRRRERALLQRRRILDAARTRFERDGYAATTLGAIAADADVSVETIYKAFRNKPGVVKALFDVAVVGDDAPVPMMQREFVARNMAEPDARKKLRDYAEHLAVTVPRTAPIQLLVRRAAATDPDLAALWEQMNGERLTGMTAFGAHLHTGGHLRDGITAEDARDILWTYNSIEVYELLVLERGWSLERYRDFVADALITALLPARGTRTRSR
jgi:AcrR family transcriptional regulator